MSANGVVNPYTNPISNILSYIYKIYIWYLDKTFSRIVFKK